MPDHQESLSTPQKPDAVAVQSVSYEEPWVNFLAEYYDSNEFQHPAGYSTIEGMIRQSTDNPIIQPDD